MSIQTKAAVFVEALAQTRDGSRFDLAKIAAGAKASLTQARAFLVEAVPQIQSPGMELSISRLRLAIEVAKFGLFMQAAESLTWQEFEKFAFRCLQLSGFETIRGITARGQGRKWQIDLAAQKGPMLLVIDCKHWKSSYYPGKMLGTARHQRDALCSMLRDARSRKLFYATKLWALPVILTLLESRDRVTSGAVFVPLEKFADFLNGVTHYSNDLPFIESDLITESPIS